MSGPTGTLKKYSAVLYLLIRPMRTSCEKGKAICSSSAVFWFLIQPADASSRGLKKFTPTCVFDWDLFYSIDDSLYFYLFTYANKLKHNLSITLLMPNIIVFLNSHSIH